MSNLPPLFRDQRKADADHLNLLSIFHFVAAGFSLLGVLFLCLHFMIFQTVFTNPEFTKNLHGNGPPPEMFMFLRYFYAAMGIWFLGSLVLNILAGMFIRGRKHRTFTLFVAGVNCLHVPIGTGLGVFTFVVLLRDSVRELYEARTAEGLPS